MQIPRDKATLAGDNLERSLRLGFRIQTRPKWWTEDVCSYVQNHHWHCSAKLIILHVAIDQPSCMHTNVSGFSKANKFDHVG